MNYLSMITENLSTLKIHKLTQAQYEREVEAGNIDVNALYLTPDEEIDIEVDTTLSQSGKAADAKAVGDRLTTLETSIPSVEGLATEEYVDNAIDNINVIIEETDPTVPAWAKASKKPTYTANEVGADASGTASSLVSEHNTATDAHSDIREALNDKMSSSELSGAIDAALAQAKESGDFDGADGSDANVTASSIKTALGYTPTAMSFTDFSMFEKWGVVGDSFANGHIVIDGNGEQYPNVSWGQILARMCGNTCTNFAASGLTTRTWLTSEQGLTLLKSKEPLQLYVLALGINDANLGTDYLGTTADITTHADTFYGNYARIIDEIKAHAPTARLILSTIASQEKNYPATSGCIANIANHYGIPLVVQSADPYFQSDFYLASRASGHPNAIGYSGMATAFKRMIEKAMVEYSDYFATYPCAVVDNGSSGGGNEPEYTNVLRTSIDTSGGIYNLTGWSGSKRISGSNGVEKDAELCCLTGYIAVKDRDVVRLKNGGTNTIWDERTDMEAWNIVGYYDSAFTWLGSVTLQPAYYGICSSGCEPTGTIANGGIVSITVPNNTNIAYMRLSVSSAQNSIDGLVVTVNEEIT